MAHHQRHPARIGAEVDRRQIGIAGHGPDVERLDPQDLGHRRHQHVVGTLANLRGAAEHGDAATAIQLQLDAGVRKVVPVDGQAGPREIRRAGQPDAAAEGQLPELAGPARAVDDAPDALGEADRPDAQVVGGQAVRRSDDAQPQVGRVDGQPLGNAVELHLLPETALGRAVTTLRTAGGLVGEDAASPEPVGRDLVGHRLQRAGVERARHAVRSIRAAIEQRLQVDAGDPAVGGHTGAEAHEHGMPAAMAVEHLLARQADLHRSIEQQRRPGDDDLVVEGIALAAEAAAVRRRDDANVGGRQLERPGQRAVQVVGVWCSTRHQLAVGIGVATAALLDGGVALEEEHVVDVSRRRWRRRRRRTAGAILDAPASP